MIPYAIVLIVLAAPIPKSTYEGEIALLISKPKEELLILSPNGVEMKRVQLKGLKGAVNAVRLTKKNRVAMIGTYQLKDGEKNKYIQRLYHYPLAVEEKLKLVYEAVERGHMIVDRDSAFGYRSEVDPAVAPAPRHWKYDLSTGKRSALDLPDFHEIRDLASDGNELLTVYWPKGKKSDARAAKISLETGQVTFISNERLEPMAISSDGKTIINYERIRHVPPDRGWSYLFSVLQVQQQRRVEYTDKIRFNECWAMAFGTQNRLAALLIERNQKNKEVIKKLSIYSSDGKSRKAVFETKEDFEVIEMDWR